MKTKLFSRITLMGLLLSAAAVSGTALADQPGRDSRGVTGQHEFHHASLQHTAYHHHRRHHRHHRHPR